MTETPQSWDPVSNGGGDPSASPQDTPPTPPSYPPAPGAPQPSGSYPQAPGAPGPSGAYPAPPGAPGAYPPPPGAPGPSGAYPPPPGAPGAYPPPPGAPTGYQPPGYPPAAMPLSPTDERMWAMLSHVGGLFFSFVAPLVVYLVFRDRSALVRNQAAEALNFQIMVMIGMVVSAVLSIVLIGFLTMLIVGIADLALCIMAAMAANRGEYYRYPATIRFVS